MVHPQFTTKTHSRDRTLASDHASKYLRSVIHTTFPLADLRNAFHFSGSGVRSPRHPRTREPLQILPSDAHPGLRGEIGSIYAGKQSLWRNAESFWSLIGWAFNCSVVHRYRWQHYMLLLDLLLDVLDDDLEDSISRAPPGDVAHGDTLVAKYLSVIGEGRANRRRVMRAILADGGAKSLAEFGEIWEGETRQVKRKDNERSVKRRRLDLENGEYGDYFDRDSDDDVLDAESTRLTPGRSPSKTHKHPRAGLPNERDPDLADTGEIVVSPAQLPASSTALLLFGGIESIRLRQRVIAILVRLSGVSPDSFLDTEDLFDLLTEFIRPLPLTVFEQFVLPSTTYLSVDQQASLNEMLFRPMTSVSGLNRSMRVIQQKEFETRYAIHAAINASAADNAKLSLLTESLLRGLWRSRRIEHESLGSLRAAVDQGIQARVEKVSRDGRKKHAKIAVDDGASRIMQASTERMRIILDVLGSSH